jgi:hypothetical protein
MLDHLLICWLSILLPCQRWELSIIKLDDRLLRP